MKNRDIISNRQQKVASIINTAIVEALRKGRMLDERLFGCPVTITKVIVSADLRVASCYFLPFNTNLKSEELLQALNNSKYAIRNFVTEKIKLKYSPEIRFHFDQGFDNAYKIENLLKQL